MAQGLVSFLEGSGKDSCQRTLDFVVSQDDHYWEHTHDFIQWLFPLNEVSHSVRNAPILTDDEIKQLRESETAQTNIERSVLRYKEFLAGTTNWRSGYDHNHLRISRVIKCLRLLVSDEEANAFKYWVAGQLGDQIDSINAESKRYWRLA